jgi:hypothetical protein
MCKVYCSCFTRCCLPSFSRNSNFIFSFLQVRSPWWWINQFGCGTQSQEVVSVESSYGCNFIVYWILKYWSSQ